MLKTPNLAPFSSSSPLQSLHGRRRITCRERRDGAHDSSALRGKSRRDTVIVDIASLLKRSDSNESASGSHHTPSATSAAAASSIPRSRGGAETGYGGTGSGLSAAPPVGRTPGGGGASQGRPGSGGSGGKRNMPPHTSESPAKKQSKWSPEEDALIIELRGSGMKWDDISKRLPGRSAISCRLHYQNYLERRSEWDEERKNKLARLYERFKPEMWAKVAEEMQVPWRAAEAMHWQLGEVDMARRAGVVPFSLTPAAGEPPGIHRSSPSRGHGHSHSQGSLPRDIQGIPSPRYGRGGHGPSPGIPPPLSSSRPLAARRDSIPPRPSYMAPDLADPGYGLPGPSLGLAPIQTSSFSQGRGGMLPSVAELTTGVSPYSTPAYSMGVPSASPVHSANASPGPYLPSLSSYPPPPPPQQQQQAPPPSQQELFGGPPPSKRRNSPPEYPGSSSRDSSRRRTYYPPPPPPHPDDMGSYPPSR
ncbi:MYB DNA-binding domain-containing protein [Rhypophila decipiens]|uniref:MYB DNA-binding domain-containing protein n=1 Tax=Rhypophila decipiens TaxID=261697 RepID=A0AAN6XUB1_9PEZI|nr:MYB DNA-binding domain-containing protein [Rhypophila decipiens]